MILNTKCTNLGVLKGLFETNKDNAGMETDYFVHPTSVVEEGARIGKYTRVWHFCHIMPTAIIGEGCNIGQNVFVDNNVSIGNRVKIQNNVSVYNSVEVEDDVFLGPSMVFTNVINPRSFIERKTELKKTRVRRGASIGANATIVCGVVIGEYSLVGAGTVVLRDVKPYSLMVGNPARQIGWISRSGNRLEFDESGRAFAVDEDAWYQLDGDQVVLLQEHGKVL